MGGLVNFNFTSWNLPYSHFCLESKTEPAMTKAQNYIGGGHRTENESTWRLGHCTYFAGMEEMGYGKTIYWEGGTPHIL